MKGQVPGNGSSSDALEGTSRCGEVPCEGFSNDRFTVMAFWTGNVKTLNPTHLLEKTWKTTWKARNIKNID